MYLRIFISRDAAAESQTMPYARYLPQEVESRGEEIYEQQIRSQVERGNRGKFVVIDIETGEFEVDEDDLQATKRVLAKRPEAVLYGLRIGYPTAYTLGGHIAKEER
jgi:hypothetical protein